MVPVFLLQDTPALTDLSSRDHHSMSTFASQLPALHSFATLPGTKPAVPADPPTDLLHYKFEDSGWNINPSLPVGFDLSLTFTNVRYG